MKTCCALLLLSLAAWPAGAECDSGTAVLVRHAEKQLTGDPEKDRDAPLSPAGRERAEALAALLGDAGIDGVITSPFSRTRDTGQPLATRLGLALTVVSVAEKDASAKLVAQLEADYCGREVVVVGHSNSVPELLRLLGVAENKTIADHQYDQLFVVHWRRGAAAQLLQLHYGQPTP